jgi:hypothetical protein
MKLRVRKWYNNISVDTPRSDHSILWIYEGCLNLGYWKGSKIRISGTDLVECYGL